MLICAACREVNNEESTECSGCGASLKAVGQTRGPRREDFTVSWNGDGIRKIRKRPRILAPLIYLVVVLGVVGVVITRDKQAPVVEPNDLQAIVTAVGDVVVSTPDCGPPILEVFLEDEAFPVEKAAGYEARGYKVAYNVVESTTFGRVGIFVRQICKTAEVPLTPEVTP